ncbi:MAG: YeeE/YedE thiosulfate transporter family protein [Pseudomonadales bacterium]
MALSLMALLCIGAIGYLAQTTGLCMVRGVNEAASGKPLFLLAILFSGAFSWVSLLWAHFFDLTAPFSSFEATWFALAGGLLFGVGAALNNGCGVSTISKLARGQLGMFATVAGWLIGWILLTFLVLDVEKVALAVPQELHYGALAGLSVLILIWLVFLKPRDRKIWLSMLMIGLLAGFAFLYEPKWTPSGLLKDISYSIWSDDQRIWPNNYRFVLMVALLLGMITAAVRTGSFLLEKPGLRVLGNHLIAGILMGVGAAIASGGNDSQLLLGLPSLSPAGLVTVLAMLLGIFVGRKLRFV